ncbi:hypothetical protein DFQ26_003338 [Actinomortierella ambigua]|nr:hypothetical protein DFQ26_003338 [Actinomortierella ambigua]
MAQPIERNQDATVYVGNLDDRCTDALVWELMAQAGPVVNVHLPKDRVTQMHQNYGFCEYATEDDADYAVKILNQVKLYGKPLRINKASSDKKNLDVGASLFIGNLSPEADEMLLRDTFSAFGVIIGHAKIARDLETGQPKGYGFVSFDNFESADAAIDAMNGQILANKPISVSFAFKKDGKGERHGSAAERLIAAQARKNLPMHQMPNRLFADVGGPGPGGPGGPPGGGPPAAGGGGGGPPGSGGPGGFPGTGANAAMVGGGRPPGGRFAPPPPMPHGLPGHPQHPYSSQQQRPPGGPPPPGMPIPTAASAGGAPAGVPPPPIPGPGQRPPPPFAPYGGMPPGMGPPSFHHQHQHQHQHQHHPPPPMPHHLQHHFPPHMQQQQQHRPPPPPHPMGGGGAGGPLPQFHGSNAIPLGHRQPLPPPPQGSGHPPGMFAPMPPPLPPGAAGGAPPPFPPPPPPHPNGGGMPPGMPPVRPPGGYAAPPPPMPFGAPPPPMPPGYPRYPGQ